MKALLLLLLLALAACSRPPDFPQWKLEGNQCKTTDTNGETITAPATAEEIAAGECADG